jgi:hypothetical protein
MRDICLFSLLCLIIGLVIGLYVQVMTLQRISIYALSQGQTIVNNSYPLEVIASEKKRGK